MSSIDAGDEENEGRGGSRYGEGDDGAHDEQGVEREISVVFSSYALG